MHKVATCSLLRALLRFFLEKDICPHLNLVDLFTLLTIQGVWASREAPLLSLTEGGGCSGRDMAADGRRGEEHHPGHCVHQRHCRGRVHAGSAEAHHDVLLGPQQLPYVRSAWIPQVSFSLVGTIAVAFFGMILPLPQKEYMSGFLYLLLAFRRASISVLTAVCALTRIS